MPKVLTAPKNTRAESVPAKSRGHFNPGLEKFLVLIYSLKFDPKNHRIHSARNVETIKNSLEEYGQQIPVITKDFIVIKGNGTLQAAQELGWTHIAAMSFNHPEKKKVRGFALVDNRSGELADWNPEILGAEMKALQAEGMDLTELGWEEYEFEPLLSAEWIPPNVTEHVEFDVAGKKTIHFTLEQFKVIDHAISKARRNLKQPDLADPDAIVVICKAYGR